MKAVVLRPVEVDVAFVEIDVPVNYGTEDIPDDFPGRSGDRWLALIDAATGVIAGWPEGREADLHMKVTDGGCYVIRDSKSVELVVIHEDYVPGWMPGQYGDYIVCRIDGAGRILEWDARKVAAAVGLVTVVNDDERDGVTGRPIDPATHKPYAVRS